MGKKKKEEEPQAEAQPQAEEVPETAPARPPAGDYCKVENLTRHVLSLPLISGKNISVGPKVRGKNIHISPPILKKNRAAIQFTWERKKMIRFLPVEESEL